MLYRFAYLVYLYLLSFEKEIVANATLVVEATIP